MDCNANFVYINAASDTPPEVLLIPPSNVVVLVVVVVVVVVVPWGEIDTGKTRVAELFTEEELSLAAGGCLEEDDDTADGAWMGCCCGKDGACTGFDP